MKNIKILGVFIFCLSLAFGQTKSVLLTNAKAHLGNGETINKALIGIKDGKIELVENALAFTFEKSDWDTIIDVEGKQIYPGFIAPNSTLGLTEIDAVRATNDFRETGGFNPNVRAQIAFNTESKVLATVKANGVMIIQATPRGGRISGKSAIMKSQAWNWEDATILTDDGIHINWPKIYSAGGWWAEPSPGKENKNYQKSVTQLTDFVKAAQAYCKRRKHDVVNLKYEAFRPVFKGDAKLYFHADNVKELNDIVDFAKEFEIKNNPVVVGGYDAWKIPNRIKDNHFSIMLTRVHSLPKYEDDDVDLPYKMAGMLQDLEIPFCLQNSGDMEAMNARNLPFLAGTARAYGLSNENAVAALTLNSAKILGIDKMYGSIEKGKSATLFVSDGDALDMRTNNVVWAWIDGKMVDLNTHQKALYKKYKAKYNEQ